MTCIISSNGENDSIIGIIVAMAVCVCVFNIVCQWKYYYWQPVTEP